jgi:hypothetical protein
LLQYTVLCRHTCIFFFHQHLILPFSPCQTTITDCDYTVCTCICIVFNFLTVISLAIVFKLKCVCVLCVSYSKCVENIFSAEESTTLYNRRNKKAGSVTVLQEFMECCLLLYADYSGYK